MRAFILREQAGPLVLPVAAVMVNDDVDLPEEVYAQYRQAGYILQRVPLDIARNARELTTLLDEAVKDAEDDS